MAPTPARDVLIVGAGILGCAVAYALAQRGLGPRVLLLDRRPPASGATSLAAALLTRVREKPHWTALVLETLRAIAELEATHGAQVGHRSVGALYAAPAALLDGVRRLADRCAPLGVQHVELDRTQALRHAPWLSPAAFDGAVYFPQESYVEPYLLASAYLRAALAMGARLQPDAEVVAIDCGDGAVRGVALADARRLPARAVVVAAGAWSNRLTVPLGAPLPLAPVRSQYWITGPAACFDRDGSIVLMPEIGAYARPEVGALLFGVREAASVVVDHRQLPADLAGFVFDPADPDGWNNLAGAAERLTRYIPALAHTGIAHYVAGPSCYTPDGELVVGAIDPVPGLWCAAGCNGAGIAVSGGVGQLVAGQVLGCLAATPDAPARRASTGELDGFDLTPFRPTRHGAFDPGSPAFLAACGAARSRKTSG